MKKHPYTESVCNGTALAFLKESTNDIGKPYGFARSIMYVEKTTLIIIEDKPNNY